MKLVALYLLTGYLLNILRIIPGFLIGTFEGEFANEMTLFVWFNFKPIPDRYLLQAVDENNFTFTIKTCKFFLTNHTLNINANGVNGIISSSEDFRFPKIFNLYLDLKFHRNNLYSSGQLLLSNIFKRDSILSANHRKKEMKILIGHNNEKIESFGCLMSFNINLTAIKFEDRGDNSFKNCISNTNETIYYENRKSYKSYQYHIFDCKISTLNTFKFCYHDMYKFDNQARYYKMAENNSNSQIVKLVWNVKAVFSYCLFRLELKNYTILIYGNLNNEIIYETYSNSVKDSEILSTISFDQINILLIETTISKHTVQYSNGLLTKTFIINKIGIMEYLFVNLSTNLSNCQRNSTNLDIQSSSNGIRYIIISIIIKIMLFFIILVGIIFSVSTKKKMPKKVSINSTNVYEEQV